MIEILIVYLFIGAVFSSIISFLASKSYYYSPTMIGWLVIAVLWPWGLVKFILRLARG